MFGVGKGIEEFLDIAFGQDDNSGLQFIDGKYYYDGDEITEEEAITIDRKNTDAMNPFILLGKVLDKIDGIFGLGLQFKPGKTFYDTNAKFGPIDGEFCLDGEKIGQQQAFKQFPIRAAWLSGQLKYRIILAIADLVVPEGRDIQHVQNTITWIIDSEDRLDKFIQYDPAIGKKLGTLRSFFTEISQDITQFPTENAYSSIHRVGLDYFIETIIGGIEREKISLSHEEIDIILRFRVDNNTKLGER